MLAPVRRVCDGVQHPPDPFQFISNLQPHELLIQPTAGSCVEISHGMGEGGVSARHTPATLEASPDGRPLTEKQRCSGSYRRAVSFQGVWQALRGAVAHTALE